MDSRIAKMQAKEATREIDYRYVKFNLTTPQGQQGYATYLREQKCTPEFFGSDLADQQRQQIFDGKHYWQAEAVYRKVFNLGNPGPWKRGDRIGRPEYVELFV